MRGNHPIYAAGEGGAEPEEDKEEDKEVVWGEGEDEMEEEDEKMEEEDEQEVRRRKGEGGEVKNDGDRYRRGGVDMMQSAAFESMDLHKSMENSHRDEEYARAYVANSAKFNQKWLKRESARSLISTTFPDEIPPKENLRWKNGGSRRRAYTGREAVEANQRRARRRDSIEQGRRRQHDKLRESDENESLISDGKNPRYKQINAAWLTYDVVDLTEDAVIVSDDDDLHYVDTQPISDPSTGLTLPSNDNDASSTSSDSFEDIDEVLTKHSQKSYLKRPRPFIILVKTSASVSCLLHGLPQREGLGM